MASSTQSLPRSSACTGFEDCASTSTSDSESSYTDVSVYYPLPDSSNLAPSVLLQNSVADLSTNHTQESSACTPELEFQREDNKTPEPLYEVVERSEGCDWTTVTNQIAAVLPWSVGPPPDTPYQPSLANSVSGKEVDSSADVVAALDRQTAILECMASGQAEHNIRCAELLESILSHTRGRR